jgi:hypothetical protein
MCIGCGMEAHRRAISTEAYVRVEIERPRVGARARQSGHSSVGAREEALSPQPG